MNYSGELNSKKNGLANLITNRIKQRITDLDLIDTGLMLDISTCVIEFIEDGLDIKIQSTDYYVYVDGNYDLTNYIIDQPDIDMMIKDIIGDMVIEYLFND